jgi:hypothetical protein
LVVVAVVSMEVVGQTVGVVAVQGVLTQLVDQQPKEILEEELGTEMMVVPGMVVVRVTVWVLEVVVQKLWVEMLPQMMPVMVVQVNYFPHS